MERYDATTIMHSLNEAYSEVVNWCSNTFKVPFRNAGKGFVAELSTCMLMDLLLKQFHWRLVYTVMSVLLLQKPFHVSKSKDHCACLERRLLTWKEGDNRNLLSEGHAFQSRLSKFSSSGRKNLDSLAQTFSILMFQGKINTALDLLSPKGKSRGALRAMDRTGDNTQETVLDILK